MSHGAATDVLRALGATDVVVKPGKRLRRVAAGEKYIAPGF